MAKAIIQGREVNDRTLKLVHKTMISPGDIIVSNGQVLVAAGGSNAGSDNIYFFRGPVRFPKSTSVAIEAGDVCYFNESDGVVNKTATNNYKVGICLEASAEGSETVLIQLHENG
jgi:predicted RecA/RadA family phage recombinase